MDSNWTMDGTSDINRNVSSYDEWELAPISWEWWKVVQLVLAILGILGNLLVMLVLFWPGRQRCATDTLIGALAVADFLTSVFIIPLPKVVQYPDTIAASIYCKVIHTSTLMWTSICASIFLLTTISVERLMAVRFPFWFQRFFSPKRISLAVVVVWVFAFVINTRSLYARYISGGQCQLSIPSLAYHRFVGVGLFLLKYVLPVIVMVVAHTWTICVLRRRRATALRKAQKHVLQMVLIVVITFIVCWTPDQIGFLLFNLGLVHFSHLFSPLYRIFVILAFANSCVNPIIYAARMPKFRKALKSVIAKRGLGSGHGIHSLFAGDIENATSDIKSDTKSKATETFEA